MLYDNPCLYGSLLHVFYKPELRVKLDAELSYGLVPGVYNQPIVLYRHAREFP